MEHRKLTRIKHYCKKLSLNRWDSKDIIDYIVLHDNFVKDPYSNSNLEKFELIKSKIYKLGILNIVDEFEKFHNLELVLFDEITSENQGLSEDEVWTIVYLRLEEIIDDEIWHAKQISKQASANKGCSVTLLMIITSSIALSFLFSRF